MGEPEDLIIDGAYIASRLGRDVWRRYSPPPAARVLRLADVRVRLELFLNGLFEAPIAVTQREPPAPVSWLARLAGHAADQPVKCRRGRTALVFFFPRRGRFGAAPTWRPGVPPARGRSRRHVSNAAARHRRSGSRDDEVRDRFLIAEASAWTQWIVRGAPGSCPALRAARRTRSHSGLRAWPSQRTRARGRGAAPAHFSRAIPLTAFGDVPASATASGRARVGGVDGRRPREFHTDIARLPHRSSIGAALRRWPSPRRHSRCGGR